MKRNISLVCKCFNEDASKWKLNAKWENWENHGWRKKKDLSVSFSLLLCIPLWLLALYGLMESSSPYFASGRVFKWISCATVICYTRESVFWNPCRNSFQLIKFVPRNFLWYRFSLIQFNFYIFLSYNDDFKHWLAALNSFF